MNQKGQALIEAILIMSLVGLCSFKLIELGLNLYHDILIDELIEQTLVCQFEVQSDCKKRLSMKLASLNFKDVQISLNRIRDTASLKLSAQLGQNTIYNRESKLTLDVSNP
ncbi:MAG: hypothetical protein WA160_11450 [Pseudobdellovibrio sp.]